MKSIFLKSADSVPGDEKSRPSVKNRENFTPKIPDLKKIEPLLNNKINKDRDIFRDRARSSISPN